MTTLELFYRLGIALVLGAFIGIQREYAGEEVVAQKKQEHPDDATADLVAGTRTFTLISLFGAVSAFVSDEFESPLIFLAGMLAITALVLAAYFKTASKEDPGITTEVASFLTVLVGALCYTSEILHAAALTVAITVMLSLKAYVRRFTRHITQKDIQSALIFGVISVIVLPLLPNEPIGDKPFDVLYPYRIWLMVVFVSGISFLGYVLNKFVGAEKGIALAGLLGGTVSSTAATMTFAERSNQSEEHARPFALAIIIAWTVMFARVLIILAVVSQSLFKILALPLGLMMVVGLVYSAFLYWRQVAKDHEAAEFQNPFELRPALQFGALYAAVLLFSRIAQIYLEDAGIYLSSIISGLVDVNAITLSLAELIQDVNLSETTAAQAIIMACISNTIVKMGMVMVQGARSLHGLTLVGGGLMIVGGIATLLFL